MIIKLKMCTTGTVLVEMSVPEIETRNVYIYIYIYIYKIYIYINIYRKFSYKNYMQRLKDLI